MEQTTNNNIKIVRLQSGEDIMADVMENDENELIVLDNPMHIIFKRMPTGQTVMMMMPWLPIEIIKENNATIYGTDILSMMMILLMKKMKMTMKKNYRLKISLT